MAASHQSPKIYILPNLMTAGNLFCGFLALLFITERLPPQGDFGKYHLAIILIFGSCLFDLLDGRMARIKGQESAFGREFDSIADVISFGLAPALLVMDIILEDFSKLAWMVAFIYLCCGAMRLARFNVMETTSKNFVGFPIPAAAGVIASLTLFLIWLNDGPLSLGNWRFVLPVLMVLLSAMMISEFEYPSFKQLNFRAKRSVLWVFFAILLVVFTVAFWEWMPAVIFTTYLLYGFVRPMLSKKWRREIEEAPEDEDEALAEVIAGRIEPAPEDDDDDDEKVVSR